MSEPVINWDTVNKFIMDRHIQINTERYEEDDNQESDPNDNPDEE